jgi:hypothetical protein
MQHVSPTSHQCPHVRSLLPPVCCGLQFTAFAKQYALEHGPIILEMDTYRWGGRGGGEEAPPPPPPPPPPIGGHVGVCVGPIILEMDIQVGCGVLLLAALLLLLSWVLLHVFSPVLCTVCALPLFILTLVALCLLILGSYGTCVHLSCVPCLSLYVHQACCSSVDQNSRLQTPGCVFSCVEQICV